MATVAAMGIGGAAAPASGLAAKKKAAKASSAAIDLTAVCDALGLRPLLGGLKIDLSPIVKVTIVKICE